MFLLKIVALFAVPLALMSCGTTASVAGNNNNVSIGSGNLQNAQRAGAHCVNCAAATATAAGCTGKCGMAHTCGKNCKPGHCVCAAPASAPLQVQVVERTVVRVVEKPVYIPVQQQQCQQPMMRQQCRQQPQFNCNSGQQRRPICNQQYGGYPQQYGQSYYGQQSNYGGGQRDSRGYIIPQQSQR